jgi:hypothetical protein
MEEFKIMAKKKTPADRIIGKDEFKKLYEGIFDAVEHEIKMNLYTEWGTLHYVTIVNENDEEIGVFDHENHQDTIRDVKKTLIKNKAFVKEITVDADELVLHTTTDLWSLIFVSKGDNDEDTWYKDEFQKILDEIKEENNAYDDSIIMW